MAQAAGKQARYQEIAAYRSGLVAKLEPGDRLPSDSELCERFGVSRMTARQAVQLLVNEGTVVRRRGDRARLSAASRFLASSVRPSHSQRA